MALADPQSLTVDGNSVSLPRTGLSLVEGSFRDATGQINLTVQHNGSKNRRRHVVKVQKTDIVSDPLIPSQNIPTSYSAHLVVDVPVSGVTIEDAQDIADALVAWATPTNIAKVLAGES